MDHLKNHLKDDIRIIRDNETYFVALLIFHFYSTHISASTKFLQLYIYFIENLSTLTEFFARIEMNPLQSSVTRWSSMMRHCNCVLGSSVFLKRITAVKPILFTNDFPQTVLAGEEDNDFPWFLSSGTRMHELIFHYLCHALVDVKAVDNLSSVASTKT